MWPSNSHRTEARFSRRTFSAPAAWLGLGLAALGSPGVHATRGAAENSQPLPVIAAHAALSAAQPTLLAVTVNGIEQDGAVTALLADGQIAISAETWTELHLRAPSSAAVQHDGQTFYVLGDVKGLQWHVDEPSQTLVINATSAAFAGSHVALDAPAPVTAVALPRGGYANYDAQWQRSVNSGAARSSHAFSSALVEAGGFSSQGTGRMTALVRDSELGMGRTRLDSTWTVDVPDRMASLRLGDAVSRAGAWGRAMRFGGIQWSTDFSVQPGFLSFPLPSMRGEAALPSTVDVYINNSHRLQSQVPAGPFDLTEVPIVTGQGQVRMVVRDLLGREQVIVQPYYVSPSLLRTGLSSFSYELGSVREDYGIDSNHYGRTMASATQRHGVTDTFTSELRAEAVGNQVSAGATGLWLLPSIGMTTMTAAASHSPDGSGSMFSAGSERQGRDGSASLQLRYSSKNFQQLGLSSGSAPRFSVVASFGGSWRGAGFGASYVHQTDWVGERTRIASLNAAGNIGRFGAVGIFLLRDLDRRSTTLSVSLTQVLDSRTSAQVTSNRNRDPDTSSALGSLLLQRSLPAGPGFGYQLSADRGDMQRTSAQGTWQLDEATLTGGLAHAPQSDDVRLGASGGVAFMNDSLFLSRRIEGSYAVVEVGDYADVQVLHDHRPVARTDAHGRAFVSGLRGYEPNHISINLADLPFDAEVERQDAVLTPPARSGTSLKIAVTRTRAASFRLIGRDGQVIPAGSSLRVAGQTRDFPVGFDGKAFVSGLGNRTRVVVSWPGRECSAMIELTHDMDEVPELGTLPCL